MNMEFYSEHRVDFVVVLSFLITVVVFSVLIAKSSGSIETRWLVFMALALGLNLLFSVMSIVVDQTGVRIFLGKFPKIKIKTILHSEIVSLVPTENKNAHGIKTLKGITYYALGSGKSAIEISTKDGSKYVVSCRDPERLILAVESAKSAGSIS